MWWIEIPYVLLGAVLAVCALYLLLLVVAALFYADVPIEGEISPTRDVVVLVPAHDEERTIGECVEALLAQNYPADRFEVVVIADNCTDETAAVARKAGATVLARDEPAARGKGRALRWAFDQLLAEDDPPDAIAIVDADSRADPELLAALVARLESSPAVQGESLLWTEGSPEQSLRAAAFLLVNRARPTGRAVVGLPANLAGNGMLFSRSVLAEHPWSAFSSTEDVEYGIRLRLSGIDPVFARGAIVWSPPAPHRQAAEEQQLRWEGGKLNLARTQIPRLAAAAVRQRRFSLLENAFELAVPPLGYLTAAAAITTGLGILFAAVGLVSWWMVALVALVLVVVALYVLVGLRAAEAPASSYRALMYAPLFVVRKIGRAHRLFGFRPDSWVRTERR
jgi:cellulose synthase/poly-beta-1,6-N-acetylglucosamine synthase-like glycosyltransferase